jgi:tripartite ATP-independent transporter DctM subunit
VTPVALVFFFIMGGIYGGFFSPTEAGAMGATAVLFIGFAMRRLNLQKTTRALWEGLHTSGMVFFIILSAFFFLRFVTASGIASALSEMIVSFRQAFDVPPLVIVAIIAIFYLITGCFLDALAVILLTLPIVYPIILALGYDPIWWGVIMVRLLETSMITPPFGLNLFVLSKAIDHPLNDIYRGVAPFIVSDVFHILLLIFVPQVSLFLPQMM